MLSRLTSARAVSRTWWIWAGVTAIAFAASTFTIAEADLWGHLRFGLDALRDGHLTSIDPYSFTQDRPWVNHEWLSEVVFALAYQAAGVPGLVIVKGAMVLAAFAIAWGAVRGARIPVRAALMALIFAGSIHATSSARPQIWTFLGIAILCRVLAEDRSRRLLPVLFVLWANAHGGWLVGLGVLGCWAFFASVVDRSRLVSWAIVVVACAAATLINPYGVGLWRFIAETVRFGREIEEWRPLFAATPDLWITWSVAVAGVLWLGRAPFKHQLPALAVSAMLAYASFRVMRINSHFLLAATILMAPAIVGQWRAPLATLPARRSRAEGWVVAYVFVACLAVSIWGLRSTTGCMRVRGGWTRPSPVPVRMLASVPPARIVTFFDWGQYAIWHLGPRLRVSMDGRRETVYTDARLADHRAIVDGTARGLALLSEWQPEYVWLPARSAATRQWLVERGYAVVWEDRDAFLAAAPGTPALLTPPSMAVVPNCFPG